jgi:hypothetical protein
MAELLRSRYSLLGESADDIRPSEAPTIIFYGRQPSP